MSEHLHISPTSEEPDFCHFGRGTEYGVIAGSVNPDIRSRGPLLVWLGTGQAARLHEAHRSLRKTRTEDCASDGMASGLSPALQGTDMGDIQR